MKRVIFLGALLLAAVGLVGCQAPKFSYAPPAAGLNPAGLSLAVMPIADHRTNRAMDKVLAKGYFNDVQRAVADELRSMNKFNSVVAVTNDAVSPVADLKLSLGVRRLEWAIPNYGALMAEAFAVGLFTGIIGGTVDMMTKTDVQGHSQLEFRLEQATPPQVLLEAEYSATITNRLKKGVCDTPKTKASVMAQALRQSLLKLKADLETQIPAMRDATNAPAAPASKE